MKMYKLFFLLVCIVFVPISCSEDPVVDDSFLAGGGDDDDDDKDTTTIYSEGFTYAPKDINADDSLTIIFKAPQGTGLYGYIGDVYIHTGVVVEGEWEFVPAEWDQNLEKCKMQSVGKNTWQVKMKPSIREWFASGTTPVTQLGIVLRSADGEKKGEEADVFVTVKDDQYQGFKPADKKLMNLPDEYREGINIVDNSKVVFVLYDKDTEGQSHDYAHILGDFNDWTLSNDETSQMYRDENKGVWWIEVEGLDPTNEYAFQYYIGYKDSQPIRLADAYSEKVLDAYNDKYIPSSTYTESMEYPEEGIGVVSVFELDKEGYNWQNNNVVIEDKGDLVIYEILLRDFTETGDISGAMSKLDYIESLGVNAIELMPVQEFDGNDSWGYNPCFFFAMDKAYGTPDMLKAFVDECHERGIAVILDVVYNHATGANPLAKLYWDSTKNKTAKNNPYFNVDAPHPYSVFHDFNHESPLVRTFIKRNLEYLLDEYKLDGFRFDLTKGFTQRKTTENNASDYDNSRIAILKDYNDAIKAVNADAIVILEHFCDIEEEKELAHEGIMMWRNANYNFCEAAMGFGDNSDFTSISAYDTDMKEDAWVGYMESHDEERMGFKQKAYGNGILKTSLEARMCQLSANAAFGLLIPGPRMIWQFGELGYDYSINSKPDGSVGTSSDRTGRKPIRWDYLYEPERKALYEVYSGLVELRMKNPDLFEQSSIKDWNVSNGFWDKGRFLRLESQDGKKLVLMGNFTFSDILSVDKLTSADVWYDFETGEPIDGQTVTIGANDFRLFTNFKI